MSACRKPQSTSRERRCNRQNRRKLLQDSMFGRETEIPVAADRKSCTSYHNLKLAIEYDSTFCRDNGGTKDSSESKIRDLVGQVNELYKRGQPCVAINLFHLDGQCDSSNDLWGDVASEPNAEKRLEAFKEKFKLVRPDADTEKTVAHLYTGSGVAMDVEGKPVRGIAYPKSLCTPGKWGFGLMAFYGNYNTDCPSARNIIAHELAHSIGVKGHGGCGSEFLVSKPFCYDCSTFSNQDIESMEKGLKNKRGQNCLNVVNAGSFETMSIETDAPKAELCTTSEQGFDTYFLNELQIVSTLLLISIGGYIMRKIGKY